MACLAVMIVFLPIPLLVSLLIIGIVFIVLGLRKGSRSFVGTGATIIGLSILSIVIAFVLYDASTVSSGEPFSPSTAYMFVFACLVFLSGGVTAIGLHQLATRNAH